MARWWVQKDAEIPIMLTEYNIHTNYEWDMRPTTVDTPWEVRPLLPFIDVGSEDHVRVAIVGACWGFRQHGKELSSIWYGGTIPSTMPHDAARDFVVKEPLL